MTGLPPIQIVGSQPLSRLSRVVDSILLGYAEELEGVHILEELHARRLGDDLFEICCIPCWVRNLALGDHVHAATWEGFERVVDEVTQRSGHFGYRVWTGNLQPEQQAAFLDALADELVRNHACEFQHSTENFIGIDAPSEASGGAVIDWLERSALMYAIEWESANDPL